MNRKRFAIIITLVLAGALQAQEADPVVLSYQRNFIRASISTKLELLNDASRITTVNMTPLYIDALSFCNLYFPVLGTDSQLMDIAALSAAKSAQYKDVSAIDSLKSVFLRIPESRVRTACLGSFSVLMQGQTPEVAFLERWFGDAVDGTGDAASDPKVLSACAAALGKIGNPESLPVLFRAATGKLDTSVVQASSAAFNTISAGYTDYILAIVAQKNVQDVRSAFSFAVRNDTLSAQDRGRIAEAVFEYAYSLDPAADTANSGLIGHIIRDSMEQLTALKWAQASPLVVKYFYRVQGDYKNRAAGVEQLVPVVNCMGAMGTQEAAQALSIFLGLLNSETEQKKTYNEQILLAVIQALGDLGDKTAFDYLLYVGYLDYPETVKQASRDALARLQW